jgi:hypothetical protein
MTRSKTQVLFNFLPGQVFEHPNGLIARTWSLRERRADDVNPDLLLDNLAEQLDQWRDGATSRAAGFPPPARHRDKYAILEPDGEVLYEVWPLVLECTNLACRKVAEFQNVDHWKRTKEPARCDKCHGRRVQLEFVMAHVCGEIRPIRLPECPQHKQEHLYLEDTGSFETSTWRCRAAGCNGRPLGGMRYRPCNCGERGPYVSLTVRQNNRFLTQTFPFVSFDRASLARLHNQPGADKVVVGSYLGLFENYEEALDEVRKGGGGDPETWKIIEQALRNAGKSEDEIDENRRRHLGVADAAFDELLNLVPEAVIQEVGNNQKARERTLVYAGVGGLRLWRLEQLRKAARDNGRQGAVKRLDAAETKLSEFGFSDAFVVENFPVALVAYGYTRLSSDPREALLRPWPPIKRHKGKTPIYATTSKTEAVFFELDARKVIDWLVDNAVMVRPHLDIAVDDLVAAKAAMLAAYVGDEDVQKHVDLLVHTLAHALIRNLGERSGFGEGTMAEYPIPSLLTFGIYANVHQEFTLGALVSLLEHRLGAWLDATAEGAQTCAWDPVCGEHEGACASCLHLAFGCTNRNQDLDRAVLFGAPAGHVPEIVRGYWA